MCEKSERKERNVCGIQDYATFAPPGSAKGLPGCAPMNSRS